MKDKNNVKLKLFVLFTVLLFLTTAAKASFYLPESNYGLDGWQGGRNYNQSGVNAYVEYAVYDTTAIAFPSIFNSIGTGKYVYAYQAFNVGAGLSPIATFELLGGNAATIADGIGSKDDGNEGIIPNNNGTSFVWRFENGVFVAYEHSAFMVFSTDYAPKEGSFKLSTTFDDNGEEPPTPDVPEPATIALLGLSAVALLRMRRSHR